MEQKERVYYELNRLRIEYEIVEHPAVYTIEDLDALEKINDKAWIVKNLFLRDAKGKRHFIVVIDKDKKADIKSIRDQLGTSNLSFASEERLMKYLMLTKGAVTPLGILNDEEKAVEVVFDRSLVGREKIGVHPNDNTATVILSYADLCKVIDAHTNIRYTIDL